MKSYLVKDLMVPISEYATVPIGTTLLEALQALEKAQQTYSGNQYQHRAILVLDEDGNVVGKISQFRALIALEKEGEYFDELAEIRKFNFSESYITNLRDRYRSFGRVLTEDILRKAAAKKVEEFMQTPTPGEFVAEECRIDTAIQRIVDGTHLGLLVTRGSKIIGILRISDVFAAVFQEMAELRD